MNPQLCVIVCAAALGLSSVANATPEYCRIATSQYQSAVGEVALALRKYAACVSGSNGHDDCSSEFSRLKSAQGDFESAVERYENECS